MSRSARRRKRKRRLPPLRPLSSPRARTPLRQRPPPRAPHGKSSADVPAGVGAEGLVAAALAQVGVSQDCTDLVQNALAGIGLTERRDLGGYDHGVSDFYRYGTPVTDDNYAPGDILIWAGAPHVAIYIGNGQAVHGGWGGNQTVVNTYASPSATPDVVRLG